MGTSRPYRIERMALQVQLDDGAIMTLFADPAQCARTEITITTENLSSRGPTEISIDIQHLAGYIMTLRNAADYARDPIEQVKELTP